MDNNKTNGASAGDSSGAQVPPYYPGGEVAPPGEAAYPGRVESAAQGEASPPASPPAPVPPPPQPGYPQQPPTPPQGYPQQPQQPQQPQYPQYTQPQYTQPQYTQPQPQPQPQPQYPPYGQPPSGPPAQPTQPQYQQPPQYQQAAPQYGQPQYGQPPQYQQPGYQQPPQYQQPGYQQPQYGAPYQQPTQPYGYPPGGGAVSVSTQKRGMPGWLWGIIGLVVVGLVVAGLFLFVFKPGNNTGSTASSSASGSVQTPTQLAAAASTPTSQTVATKAPAAPTAAPTQGGQVTTGQSNAELVQGALVNTKNIKSYHVEMNVEQAGQSVQLSGDVDTAKRDYKLDVNAAGIQISEIKIGNDSYVSMDGGATWTKSDSSLQGMNFDSMLDMFKDAKPGDVSKVQDKLKNGTPPTEVIDGETTRHITANAQDLSAIGANAEGTTVGTMDMWVTTGDTPIFRRLKIDGTSGGQPIKADITWSKIGEPVNIEAPATTGEETPTAPTGLKVTPIPPVGSNTFTPLPVGATAPDFYLPGDNGQTYNLSALQGKVVVLEFFAPWCPHCQDDVPMLNQVYSQYKDKGVEVLSVSASPYGKDFEEQRSAGQDPSPISMDDITWFHDTYGTQFPLLFDKDVAAAQEYGIYYYPTIYVVGKDGKIAAQVSGSYTLDSSGQPQSADSAPLSAQTIAAAVDAALK